MYPTCLSSKLCEFIFLQIWQWSCFTRVGEVDIYTSTLQPETWIWKPSFEEKTDKDCQGRDSLWKAARYVERGPDGWKSSNNFWNWSLQHFTIMQKIWKKKFDKEEKFCKEEMQLRWSQGHLSAEIDFRCELFSLVHISISHRCTFKFEFEFHFPGFFHH